MIPSPTTDENMIDHGSEAAEADQTEDAGQLEIDDTWDGDSALGGMSQMSSTESVGSSIYDHVVENGRTYHRFKEGKYMLPNDEKEQNRLDYQHQLYTAVLNGKLYVAPIGDTPKNVLDVGTGTGIWAIEFGLEHPSAHVIGIDLSPIQPSYSPPNVTFEICDAEDEWLFRQPFDFIHMRAMVTSFKNPSFVFSEAFHSLAPGGYIELREPVLPFQFMTPPPADCALKEWGDKLMEAAALSGRDWGVATRYADILSQIGFVNIVERGEAMALSPWVKGKQNKHLSLLLQHDILNLLEPMSMALFTRVLGWDAQRVLDLLELVKKDVQDTSIHAYSKGVHIYAQRPYAQPDEET